MSISEFLFEMVTWGLSVALMLGGFLGLLYVLAWLIDKGEWK